MSRSRLVRALCLVAAIAISANVVHCDNLNAAAVNLKTTSAPNVIKTTPPAGAGVAVSPANGAVHGISTIKPVVQNNVALKQDIKVTNQVSVAPAIVAPAPIHLSTAKPSVNAIPSSPSTVAPALAPADRVSQYFEPVCGQLDKLQPKQMFKIQSQLKQFVEKTSGKMSLCFMQTYSMDPNLTPVNKAQLQTICGSRNLELGAKGSFKSFLDCAANHYDPSLDAELVHIQKSRATLGANHDHSKDNLANMPHDEDELSLINAVVNKVIADNKDKIQNMSAPKNIAPIAPIIVKTTAIPLPVAAKPTTLAPVVKVATAITQAPSLAEKLKPSNSPANKVLNDKHGAVVVIDQISNSATTVAPKNVTIAVVPKTTVAPKPIIATLLPVKSITTAVPKQAGPATTAKPIEVKLVVTTIAPAKPTLLGQKIVGATGPKTTPAPTTVPAVDVTKSTVVSVIETAKMVSTAAPVTVAPKTTPAAALKVTVAITTAKPNAKTTKKPETGSTAAPKASVAPKVSAAPTAAAVKTTAKPAEETVKVFKEEVVKDSEVKKVSEEIVKEVEKKDVEKKEDDLDAKKAIKSLKAQRADAHGSPADIRMHQIEHERQMSIDPVGHTIKHQEYEKKKASINAAKVKSTTQKPE